MIIDVSEAVIVVFNSPVEPVYALVLSASLPFAAIVNEVAVLPV